MIYHVNSIEKWIQTYVMHFFISFIFAFNSLLSCKAIIALSFALATPLIETPNLFPMSVNV
jgi:hypothetical protein